MIVYLDSSRGISAGLVLGALLDAGADASLVQRILGTLTIPRIALIPAQEMVGGIRGTAASLAVGPIPRDTRLLDVLRTIERGKAPLAVRTWGGGMLAQLLDAEALVRGLPLDAVPVTDIVTVAELLAVSAALAALRVIRVYAAPLAWREDGTEAGRQAEDEPGPPHTGRDAVRTALLVEAEWPEPEDGRPAEAITPGGAAILAALAESSVPSMRLAAVGYGIGPEAPRVIRCMVGEPYAQAAGLARGMHAAHTHDHHSDSGDHA
jgi:uncharacterized protein (DUF111 family)